LTERLYYHDSYLRQFDAQVVSLSDDGLRVVLDRTAFYPTSGGQPHDLGSIAGIQVVDVIDRDEHIEHVLATPLKATAITAEIDWPRRFLHMQQHTAQHLLSAVMQEEFNLETVSFHLGTEESTVDVEPAQVSPETLRRIEVRANERICANLATSITFEDAATAQGLRKQSARAGILRVVTIDGLDRSACGGTHVARTGEIGFLRLGKTEKIRKALRIYFYAGARALAWTHRQSDDAKAELAQLRDKAADSDKQRQRLSTELATLRGAQRAAAIAPNPQGHRLWIESVAELNEAARQEANAFLSSGATAVLLLDPATGATLLAAAESSGLDCGQLFKQAAAECGGKGGGSARQAQGNLGPQANLDSLAKRLLGALL
jgi:alanyl-tRNA synthetase